VLFAFFFSFFSLAFGEETEQLSGQVDGVDVSTLDYRVKYGESGSSSVVLLED